MLAGTESEARVRAALAQLGEGERSAVILRDAYDLPPQAVGVALRRGQDSATNLTAAGRLALVEIYDERPSPTLSGHSGRTTVDVTSLSRLADDTLDAPHAAPLRRHAGNCASCEEMLETLARGRRLAAGLPIIAMDDDAREALIERIAERATATLPSHDAVLKAVDEDHDPGPPVSPIVAVIALVLAVALGIAVAAVSRPDHSLGTLAAGPAPSLSPVVPSFSVSPSPHRSYTASPSATPTLATSPTSPVIEPSSPATSVAARPALTLSPKAARSGSDFTVLGTGWVPGTRVFVSYAGKPQTSARVRADGSWQASLVANAFLPGSRRVSATDGQTTVNALFLQQF
jgi:hypothetical protein